MGKLFWVSLSYLEARIVWPGQKKFHLLPTLGQIHYINGGEGGLKRKIYIPGIVQQKLTTQFS